MYYDSLNWPIRLIRGQRWEELAKINVVRCGPSMLLFEFGVKRISVSVFFGIVYTPSLGVYYDECIVSSLDGRQLA